MVGAPLKRLTMAVIEIPGIVSLYLAEASSGDLAMFCLLQPGET